MLQSSEIICCFQLTSRVFIKVEILILDSLKNSFFSLFLAVLPLASSVIPYYHITRTLTSVLMSHMEC